MDSDIAKAGWMYRKSSVLNRWKKNWFELDRHGDLRYYETKDDSKAEERIVVRASVLEIIAGARCSKSNPPEDIRLSRDCFLELRMRSSEAMLLCAESADDMKAWQTALEDARTMNINVVYPGGATSSTTIYTPPGFTHYSNVYTSSGYPGQVIYQNTQLPINQVVYTPNVSGTTIIGAPTPRQQIVYVDNGLWPYRRYHHGTMYSRPYYYW